MNGVEIGSVDTAPDREEQTRAIEALLRSQGLDDPSGETGRTLLQAFSFARATKLIYQTSLSTLPADPGGIAPFVVNGTFAIELYIKALKVIHHVPPKRGHDVLEHFSQLPAPLQASIETLRSSYFANKKLPPQGSISEMLGRVGNAFETWRYQHEKGSAPVVDVIDVFATLDVLHQACYWECDG